MRLRDFFQTQLLISSSEYQPKLVRQHLATSPMQRQSRQKIYSWIKTGINLFPEWYQPVDFGGEVIAHVTTPPSWQPRPELVDDITRGKAKWDFIVKKHLPSLSDKRVLDLGCSSGLYSLKMAKLGAREVIGIDRNTTIKHRSTDTPPAQDVIAQAEFVKKSFELLDRKKYPIHYIAQDVATLAQRKLGHFDVVLALCMVYHELDQMPKLIGYLASITDFLVLQANTMHGGELGKWASVSTHLELLLKAGFNQLTIDAPDNYPLPIIVAQK